MKKTVSVFLAVIMLFGIVVPVFAEDETTENPGQKAELVYAYIESLPDKNEVVRKQGEPEYPDGIEIVLEYSDHSAICVSIEEKEGKFYAGDEEVTYIGKNTDKPLYGRLTAYLEMKGGEIEMSYEFYSLEDTKPGVELVGATIVYVPVKYLVAYTAGSEPNGIVFLLKYSDGSAELKRTNWYYSETSDYFYHFAGPYEVFYDDCNLERQPVGTASVSVGGILLSYNFIDFYGFVNSYYSLHYFISYIIAHIFK